MTKQDHVLYWKELSEKDIITADYNLAGEQNVPALFFYHLATEKLLDGFMGKGKFERYTSFYT